MEADHAAIGQCLDHTELAGLILVHWNRRDGRLRALVHVVFEHLADVHAVDVVGAEDHHEMRIGLFDQVDLLIYGLSPAPLQSLFRGTELLGDLNNKVLLQKAADFPAVAQMLEQALALELNQHVGRIDARVDQIAQHEIDDAVPAAERHGRFGSFFGEWIEPGPFSSSQHKGQHANLHGAYFVRRNMREANLPAAETLTVRDVR